MKSEFNLDKILDFVEQQQLKQFSGIPLGFNRYKEALDSVERGDSVVIASGVAGGKTSYAIDKYLINSVIYDFNNPGVLDLHIDYFNLEETDERFNLKILSNINYRFSGSEYSVSDFLNRNGKKLLLNNTKQFINLKPFVAHYNSKVNVYNDKSPLLIKKRLLESIKLMKSKGLDDKKSNYYHIVIIDNLKFLKKDTGHNSNKDAIDDLTLGVLQDLRQEFNVIPIVLQHLSVSADNMIVDARGTIIDNRLKPSLNNLGDSSATQSPATHVIGIFKPHRFGIETYPKGKYDITKLQDSFRSVIPLKGRDNGFEGQDLAMHFKGNVSAFEELPPFDDFLKNQNLYNKYNPKLLPQVKKSYNINNI